MTGPNVYAPPREPPIDPSGNGPLTCPWCNAAATPSASVQSCAGCGRKFTLSAGPAMDPAVVPAPWQHAGPDVTVKWSIVVTYRVATLDPGGVRYGTLDPVVGLATIDQSGIAYGDVGTIAVWRKFAPLEPIIAILVPIPIAAFFAYTVVAAATNGKGGAALILSGITLAFALLGGWMVYRGFALGRRNARIVGRWSSCTVPFDASRRFHEQLFRRCGLQPPPIP